MYVKQSHRAQFPTIVYACMQYLSISVCIYECTLDSVWMYLCLCLCLVCSQWCVFQCMRRRVCTQIGIFIAAYRVTLCCTQSSTLKVMEYQPPTGYPFDPCFARLLTLIVVIAYILTVHTRTMGLAAKCLQASCEAAFKYWNWIFSLKFSLLELKPWARQV